MSFGLRFIHILCFVFIFIFLTAFKIKRESSGQLTVSENNCEQAQKTMADFAAWKKISDGINCDSKKISYVDSGNQCLVNATSCLPEHVQKYQGVSPEVAGPNCWNTALVMSKILPYHRYTNDKEFAYYMRPPLCRALKNGEERKPGDIGSISNKFNSDIVDGMDHVFIYVNDKMAYTKPSPHPAYPYGLHSMDRLEEHFGLKVDSKCFSNELNNQCGIRAEFYRCQSINEYLASTNNIPSQLLEAFNKSEDIDKCVESFVMQDRPLTNEAMENIRQTGDVLVKYLQEQRAKSPQPRPNSKEEFMLGALQVRLSSLYDQLHAVSDYYPYSGEEGELKRLRDLISDSK